MKILLVSLVATLMTGSALAADFACLTTATEKKLAGAAKASFVKKCVRDRCEADAASKKLAGAAKNSFAGRCMADGLQPYCGEQTAAKKLAGAAKTSFMNKCQSGR